MFSKNEKTILAHLQLRGVLWQQDLKKLTGINNVHKSCNKLEKKGILKSFKVGHRLFWEISKLLSTMRFEE